MHPFAMASRARRVSFAQEQFNFQIHSYPSSPLPTLPRLAQLPHLIPILPRLLWLPTPPNLKAHPSLLPNVRVFDYIYHTISVIYPHFAVARF